MIRILALILCLVVVLMGCSRTTTVILPPESTAATAPTTVHATTLPGTEAPTEPTMVPTDAPTTAPSTEPTEAPTTTPTEVPTEAPTDAPTESPTEAPSDAPTERPTTSHPTERPTEPTVAPSSEPTEEPTTEPYRHPVYQISGHRIGSLEYSLLDAINAKRAASSLSPLAMDSTLCALATIRAYECTENFSHTRPDGRGAFTVLSDYGYYIWSHLRERIHCGTSGLSAGTLVKGWMYNEDFSANILSEQFTHMGIGVYENGGTTYIVCFFAG